MYKNQTLGTVVSGKQAKASRTRSHGLESAGSSAVFGGPLANHKTHPEDLPRGWPRLWRLVDGSLAVKRRAQAQAAGLPQVYVNLRLPERKSAARRRRALARARRHRPRAPPSAPLCVPRVF